MRELIRAPMPVVAVSRRIPDEVARLIQSRCELRLHGGVEPLGERLAGFLHGADAAVLVPYDKVDAALLDQCPRLRVIVNASAGFDNLDLSACTARGILCANAPTAVAEATADFAIGLMIAASRRIVAADVHVREGLWRPSSYERFMGSDVCGSTIGILGFGRIGQAIARRAAFGFGMKVLAFSRSPIAGAVAEPMNVRQVHAKEDLLLEANHIVLALPYAPSTRHIIGAAELALVRPGATLVNIGRGGLVDERALAAALSAGRLAAAALDVLEREPSDCMHLADVPNLVLTPHIASATERTRIETLRQAFENLFAALSGIPIPHLLNPRAVAMTNKT